MQQHAISITHAVCPCRCPANRLAAATAQMTNASDTGERGSSKRDRLTTQLLIFIIEPIAGQCTEQSCMFGSPGMCLLPDSTCSAAIFVVVTGLQPVSVVCARCRSYARSSPLSHIFVRMYPVASLLPAMYVCTVYGGSGTELGSDQCAGHALAGAALPFFSLNPVPPFLACRLVPWSSLGWAKQASRQGPHLAAGRHWHGMDTGGSDGIGLGLAPACPQRLTSILQPIHWEHASTTRPMPTHSRPIAALDGPPIPTCPSMNFRFSGSQSRLLQPLYKTRLAGYLESPGSISLPSHLAIGCRPRRLRGRLTVGGSTRAGRRQPRALPSYDGLPTLSR